MTHLALILGKMYQHFIYISSSVNENFRKTLASEKIAASENIDNHSI